MKGVEVMADCRTVDFFLGANTPEGFRSYFDAFDEPISGFRRYLIKGGPGTGKSGMMKQVFKVAQQDASPGMIERIHCSSDADSLDAVIWEAGRCAIFDATPPHVVEPKYPGAYDRMVSVTEGWDNAMLMASLSPIVSLSKKISSLHRRCQFLLSASNMLYLQNQLALSAHWQESKLKKSSERFAKRLLYGLKETGGKEQIRMLSAVTNQGVITYTKTVSALADRIVCIKDSFGPVSEAYLQAVKAQAKKQGLSMILCMSPFHSGKIDHIIFPNQRIAVVTEDLFQRFADIGQTQSIRSSRYLPPKTMKTLKASLRHRNRMMCALIGDAAECLKQAKALHDKLEGYYTPAVDFDKVNALTEQVIKEMKEQKEKLLS